MKDGTQVQQHCRNSIWPWSRLANLLFHPSSSELLAVSSLAWQAWHSGVSGSLFLFYFVSCSDASYKISTSPPCNWAKHSGWKSAACGRHATHLSPSPLCHCCVSRPNHHQLMRNIPPASASFEASPDCLLVRVSYCNSAYDNDRWLTIFLDIARFVRPKLGHVLFFLCFSSLFFHQTYAGARKKNKMPKEKKNTGSVSQTTWPTNDIQNLLCWAQSFFNLFMFYQTMIELNSFQSPQNLTFPRALDLSSRAKNVLESSTETFINIANAFVLPRSLVRWEARRRFRFQTKHISCLSQSKTSLLSAESTFDDFNRKDLGFWFSLTRQCNSLASA